MTPLWDKFTATIEQSIAENNPSVLLIAADIANDFTESDWQHEKVNKDVVSYAMRYLAKHNLTIKKKSIHVKQRKLTKQFDRDDFYKKRFEELAQDPNKYGNSSHDMITRLDVLFNQATRIHESQYTVSESVEETKYTIQDDFIGKISGRSMQYFVINVSVKLSDYYYRFCF